MNMLHTCFQPQQTLTQRVSVRSMAHGGGSTCTDAPTTSKARCHSLAHVLNHMHRKEQTSLTCPPTPDNHRVEL
jgi:hypothetical protein